MSQLAASALFEYLLYMLWVYSHYKYAYSFSAGIDCRRQSLTSTIDPRAVKVKT